MKSLLENTSQVLIASRRVSVSSAFLRLMLKHKVDFVIPSGFGNSRVDPPVERKG
ncbi:MAG: hypothetical protein FGF48_09670 [Candidatus Brockarchaeota archaeon]|nr:hypothetical protein [Candidatus Brockarchaeota archaeon]